MAEHLINLELSIEEVNNILIALSDKPYREVFELIKKIKEQAEPQAINVVKTE